MLRNGKHNLFVQFSYLCNSEDNTVANYLTKVWAATPGYAKASDHYFEIPQWIAAVAGRVSGDSDLLVVTPEWLEDYDNGAINLYEYAGPESDVYGSVMDANLANWIEFVTYHEELFFFLGGYVDPEVFAKFDNVVWIESVDDLGVRAPDYSLFNGTRCIPRLALSGGCLYKCAFCTIPRGLTKRTMVEVLDEVDSWRGLEFELVYLDDKTFGQVDNWDWTDALYHYIKSYNPQFKGWIVQTTAHEINRHAEEWVKNYHVKVIECGVETLHGECLKAWRKPHGVKHINQAAETIRKIKAQGLDVTFVPNLIFGIEQRLYDTDVYEPTIQWVQDNADVIGFINPYILCQYVNSKGDAAHSEGGAADLDENNWDKSWLNADEIIAASAAMDTVLEFTS